VADDYFYPNTAIKVTRDWLEKISMYRVEKGCLKQLSFLFVSNSYAEKWYLLTFIDRICVRVRSNLMSRAISSPKPSKSIWGPSMVLFLRNNLYGDL
jgi:hypothetical protein